MPAVILSPHLDDAVLSCWHLLTQPGEVVVINVFAGVPTHLGAPAWWDEYTGASDSAERVRERIEEDRRALAVTGRTAVNLGFLDEQYRPEEQPLAPLTEQIERLLDPGVQIYAPAAFANHSDHALVRAAALQLRVVGFEVSLYADLPHAVIRGWPVWVTGEHRPSVEGPGRGTLGPRPRQNRHNDAGRAPPRRRRPRRQADGRADVRHAAPRRSRSSSVAR